jgi:hypothetical protein
MAVYPFLRITANNLGYAIQFESVLVWGLAVVAAVAGVLAIWHLYRPDSVGRLGVVLIPLLWLLFNFQLFEQESLQPFQLWALTAVAVTCVMVIATQWAWVRAVIPLWAVLLAVFQLIPIATYSAEPVDIPGGTPGHSEPEFTPNIWVFIPDGYTSPEEVLRQTGVDTSDFLRELRNRGFATPSSVSNYPRTFLSLASILDQTLVAVDGDNVRERKPFYELIQGENQTADVFRSWGYRYVFATTSSWDGSLCTGAPDICVTGSVMDRTSQAILSMTPFEDVVDLRDDVRAVAEYSNPDFVVDRVQAADPDEPFLVVSHLMQPHPPSYRTADCEIKEEAGIAIHTADWERNGYADSIECLNDQFIDAVEQIIETDPDAIVVIQADHGTRLEVESQSDGSREYETLSALKLPCHVPEEVAAVDVLRLTTACVAGDQPELIGDDRFAVEDFIIDEIDGP